ncbi:hypothetical protein D3C78_430170 [compost metagenome]
MIEHLRNLKPYKKFSPKVPVYEATPENRAFIHRFYDTSPISPSGRYIAVTEFLFESRSPSAGDIAFVCVFDLATQSEVYKKETEAWDSQVGCHAQWGSDDSELFFNVIGADQNPHGLKVNIFTGTEYPLHGCIYMVSADGKLSISPCLIRISQVQAGYGVKVHKDALKKYKHDPDKDGIFITNTKTGERQLLLSLREIVQEIQSNGKYSYLDPNRLFVFHLKWNYDSSKIMAILRHSSPRRKHNKSKNFLIVMDRDGTNIKLLVSPEQWIGGHHPTWCPNGNDIVMNLNSYYTKSKLLICADLLIEKIFRKLKIKYTSRVKKLSFTLIDTKTGKASPVAINCSGSGHPTTDPTQRYILTDAYPNESVSFGDGTVPIRLIDIASGLEHCLIRIKTLPSFTGKDLDMRVDPHPAWDRSGKAIVFNAYPNGKRQVFIADMSQICLE